MSDHRLTRGQAQRVGVAVTDLSRVNSVAGIPCPALYSAAARTRKRSSIALMMWPFPVTANQA